MCRNSRIFISGGCHEACSGAYAFLLWDRNDASFVYSGNTVYADLYHWMPDSGLLSFLRMRSIRKIAELREIRDCTENMKRKRGHVKRHVLSISSNYALSTKPEHLLSSSINFNLNRFNVCFPDRVGSSMGVAHVISEVSSLFTDCTFSHDCTSLTGTWSRKEPQHKV